MASGKGAGEPPEVGGARGLRLLKPGCKYEYANMPRFTVNWRAPVGLDAQNPPLERKRNDMIKRDFANIKSCSSCIYNAFASE